MQLQLKLPETPARSPFRSVQPLPSSPRRHRALNASSCQSKIRTTERSCRQRRRRNGISKHYLNDLNGIVSEILSREARAPQIERLHNHLILHSQLQRVTH
ncbi:hypothetical protein AAHE18_02G133100 [Arachis hypogaea]